MHFKRRNTKERKKDRQKERKEEKNEMKERKNIDFYFLLAYTVLVSAIIFLYLVKTTMSYSCGHGKYR